MPDRSLGLSENVRIIPTGHIHNYVDVTTFGSYEEHLCAASFCPAPYRWRWNNFFDWSYVSELSAKGRRE